jgi:uncharacterized membrane protein YfcA
MRPAAAFALAFACAAASALAALWWIGVTTLRVPGTTVPAAYAAAPLVGLAVFQIVFGTLAGRWRGAAFWAAALPLTGAIVMVALAATLTAAVMPATALAAALAVLFGFGFWAATRGP